MSLEEEESKSEVIDTAGDLIKALAQFSPETPRDGQDGALLMIFGGRME